MFRDPLQERLKQMEENSPSANIHKKSLVGRLQDKLYFVGRYFEGSVEEYTPEQRSHDIWMAAKGEADREMFHAGSVTDDEIVAYLARKRLSGEFRIPL